MTRISILLTLLGSTVSGQVCNGYSEYCGKRYSEVSFTGAHDSAFVRTSAFDSLFGNQFYPVTTQLNSGVRMLQTQVHAPAVAAAANTNSSSGIQLCHSSCSYPGSDFGPLERYLSDVKTWLDQNPREVITILWVNGGFNATTWQSAYASTGLLRYVYTPPTALQGVLTLSDWPTLQDLIANDTRVVSFIDSGADVSSVPWLLDEFSNVWETSYDETFADQFSCALDRPYASQAQSAIPASQKLYLINHFLDYELGTTGIDVPNVTYASVTNSVSDRVGSLSSQVTNCTALNGRKPNFLLVDFFDQGNGSSVAAAAVANGVSYRPSSLFPGAFPVPGSDNYTSPSINRAAGNDVASFATGSSTLVSRVGSSGTLAPTALVSGGGPRTLSATVSPSSTTTPTVPSNSRASSSASSTSVSSSGSSVRSVSTVSQLRGITTTATTTTTLVPVVLGPASSLTTVTVHGTLTLSNPSLAGQVTTTGPVISTTTLSRPQSIIALTTTSTSSSAGQVTMTRPVTPTTVPSSTVTTPSTSTQTTTMFAGTTGGPGSATVAAASTLLPQSNSSTTTMPNSHFWIMLSVLVAAWLS